MQMVVSNDSSHYEVLRHRRLSSDEYMFIQGRSKNEKNHFESLTIDINALKTTMKINTNIKNCDANAVEKTNFPKNLLFITWPLSRDIFDIGAYS